MLFWSVQSNAKALYLPRILCCCSPHAKISELYRSIVQSLLVPWLTQAGGGWPSHARRSLNPRFCMKSQQSMAVTLGTKTTRVVTALQNWTASWMPNWRKSSINLPPKDAMSRSPTPAATRRRRGSASRWPRTQICLQTTTSVKRIIKRRQRNSTENAHTWSVMCHIHIRIFKDGLNVCKHHHVVLHVLLLCYYSPHTGKHKKKRHLNKQRGVKI